MISIEIQDENGETLREFADPGVIAAIDGNVGPSSPCLRFIDPYGDTTFNRVQISVLVTELRELEGRLGADLRMRVRALAAFAAEAGEHPHQYLKFIGD